MNDSSRRRSRDRILELLRRGPATIEQLTSGTGLSRGAVRVQLASLERDGFVARRGRQRGITKPSATYEITAPGRESLSRAYVPMLTILLRVLERRLAPGELEEVLREVGREILDGRERPSGSLDARVRGASALFDELGGLTRVEERADALVIRSDGCPFAATVERHPEACAAAESLFAELIGQPVTSCCEREPWMRCCFVVAGGAHAPDGAGRGTT